DMSMLMGDMGVMEDMGDMDDTGPMGGEGGFDMADFMTQVMREDADFGTFTEHLDADAGFADMFGDIDPTMGIGAALQANDDIFQGDDFMDRFDDLAMMDPIMPSDMPDMGMGTGTDMPGYGTGTDPAPEVGEPGYGTGTDEVGNQDRDDRDGDTGTDMPGYGTGTGTGMGTGTDMPDYGTGTGMGTGTDMPD
ncbi:MAG: hypothetical protein QF739_11640, partial [Acidimicrobiales bacterium]|nr:hypothetical protein [Acidimicrobiales bacterium]